jgi:long-chain acyl-CoA synthetase
MFGFLFHHRALDDVRTTIVGANGDGWVWTRPFHFGHLQDALMGRVAPSRRRRASHPHRARLTRTRRSRLAGAAHQGSTRGAWRGAPMTADTRSLSRANRPADAAVAADADTFPKLLLGHARERGTRPAMREKELGIWQVWTWAQMAEEIAALAGGLAALGFGRDDKLAVIGDNRPRLYWALAAAQALGGVPVPVYQDAVAGEMAFVLEHAEARFAICEDQEQVDKLLAIRDRLPRLEAIVYDDPRGMRHYVEPCLHAYEAVRQEGRTRAERQPGWFDAEVARGKGGEIAVILYTSGTTGNPKGVMLTYDNMILTVGKAVAHDGLGADDEVLAYLPMAWAGDHIFCYAQSYVAGFCVSCPESGATVMNDLRELGPTYFFAPPRIWESILTGMMIRIEDAGRLKRALFHYFIGIAERFGGAILDQRPAPFVQKLLYRLGEVLVYGPLKNTLGFSRIRLAYTAGEAIGPDTFLFFRSLGVNIKQLYGMTEASVFVCMQPDGAVKPDTVGIPLDGVEIMIAENGEVLYRSPGVFAGYHKNPEATRAAKRRDGWVHSGDAGFIGEDRQLRIIDRAQDVGRLADGTVLAPKFIENKLKFFADIKEAVVFGDDRPYAAALINIDLQAVGNWAERHGVTYGGYQDLAGLDAVGERIAGYVAAVNRDLAREPRLAGSQIRRFLILPKELDADDGELTRTRKVRRRLIAERYRPLVEALYSDRTTARIASEVTFEDGRKSSLEAESRIRDAETAAPAPAAA